MQNELFTQQLSQRKECDRRANDEQHHLCREQAHQLRTHQQEEPTHKKECAKPFHRRPSSGRSLFQGLKPVGDKRGENQPCQSQVRRHDGA